MQIDSTQLTGFAQAIFEKLGTAEEKAGNGRTSRALKP